MLDKKTAAVLDMLVQLVGESYKVVNKAQLLAELPPRLGVDEQNMAGILAFLKENDYIDIKYQDKNEICLSATVKATSYSENEKNVVERASISAKQVTLLIVGVFLAAFAGALVASLIGMLF